MAKIPKQRANDRYKDYLDGQLTIQWYSTGMLGFGTGTNVLRSVGKSILLSEPAKIGIMRFV